MRKYLKSEKGMTRLTVLLLIIALLFLVGALSFVLYNKKQQNSQIANTTETKSEETEVSNSSKNETEEDDEEKTKKSTPKGNWTQDKTEVTNGDVTLEVGSEVTGYEANGIDEWYVLGVENGNLLITTNKGDEEVELSGKDGYENGIEILDNAVQDYDDGNLSESVRSINVDDINRVTGFNPGEDKSYGKEYTFEDKGTFWNGEEWITLKEGDKITLTRTTLFYRFRKLFGWRWSSF